MTFPEIVLGFLLLASLVALAVSLVFLRKCRIDLAKSELKAQEASKSEARFQAIAENMPQMAWMAHSNGTTIWQNERWFDYTGMQRGAGNWEDFIHPDHLDRVASGMSRAETTQSAFEDTFPIKGHDGTYRWFLSRALPIRSRDGQALYFGTDTDVTESIENAERLKILMREVDHRAKNMLEIVQSVIAFTRADDVDDFVKAITERIASLGRTQSLLAEKNWTHLELGDAIVAQLAPILDAVNGTRINVSGPEVSLKAKPAESLLMVLHELATNAMKYGSLSAKLGQVNVNWARNDEGGLTLNWIEQGGPKIGNTPTRRGFGLELIGTLFDNDCARFEWRPDGLKVEITLAEDAVAGPMLAGNRVRSISTAGLEAGAVVAKGTQPIEPHVLVVEDEKMIARLMIRRLEKVGCKIIGPASTVEYALALIDTQPLPDFAFVDWNLNGATAKLVIDALEAKGVPFCMATGNANADDDSSLGLVLEKPFSADRFSEVLSLLMQKVEQPHSSRD